MQTTKALKFARSHGILSLHSPKKQKTLWRLLVVQLQRSDVLGLAVCLEQPLQFSERFFCDFRV